MKVHFHNSIILLCTVLCLAAQTLMAAEFAPVVPGRVLNFPRDHGAHPEFKTEWWYFTGHLHTESGKRFGFQWTVFRSALVPPGNSRPAQASAWRADQVYLGHLALSDLGAKKFYFEDQAARGALNLGGAEIDRFKVWLPGFSAETVDGTWRVKAGGESIGLDLLLGPPGEALLHGQNGFSPKSTEAGRASYYYSLPQIPLSGELRLLGKTYRVTGAAWMDHEFGSGQLAAGQSGWDWMGLPLGGKSALMLYRLRDKKDPNRNFLSGTFVDAEGKPHSLKSEDIQLTPLTYWTSPRSGGKYPMAWRVVLPGHRLEIKVEAAFPEQELDTRNSTRVTYWEGSVSVRGKVGEREIDSRGYLEMTGYAGDFDKEL